MGIYAPLSWFTYLNSFFLYLDGRGTSNATFVYQRFCSVWSNFLNSLNNIRPHFMKLSLAYLIYGSLEELYFHWLWNGSGNHESVNYAMTIGRRKTPFDRYVTGGSNWCQCRCLPVDSGPVLSGQSDDAPSVRIIHPMASVRVPLNCFCGINQHCSKVPFSLFPFTSMSKHSQRLQFTCLSIRERQSPYSPIRRSTV